MEIDPKLRQLQLAELEILDEFVRICEKHGLQYFLVGGTLLGAVRHQGFIPWDDDIDVAMLREDYDRFARICADDLDPQYFYQCPDTDPCYFLTYAKLRKNGTEVYEERFQNARFHKGVFIDIFPLDFCPRRGPVCHFLFNVLAVMNYRGQVDSGESCHPYSELLGKIGYGILRLLSPRQVVRLRRRLIRLSEKASRRQYVASYSGAYGYEREISPIAWYQNHVSLSFEGRNFHAPADPGAALRQLYGDTYLNCPPESERRHHIQLKRIQI